MRTLRAETSSLGRQSIERIRYVADELVLASRPDALVAVAMADAQQIVDSLRADEDVSQGLAQQIRALLEALAPRSPRPALAYA